jgi:arylsulfatase A-like enzyme
VLITLDTTRADQLGCYGDPRGITPVIDSVARESVLFQTAVAPAPTTLASHTSIMTGCWPQTTGIVRNGYVVHDDNEMLAEILSREGFHTAAFLGSFALARRFGFAQGFDCFDERFEAEVDLSRGVDQNQRRAASVVDAALAHLDELGDAGLDERLFLFLHFFDAHSPYDPLPPWDHRFAPPGRAPKWSLALHSGAILSHQRDYLPEAKGLAGIGTDGLPIELVDGEHMKPKEIDFDLAALHAGEIGYVDSQVGRLLSELDRRGILSNALVVITADHGETFFEHGDYWSHGTWVYDTTVHVPLLMRFPDQRAAGRLVPGVVSTIDVAPTVLTLLGLDVPATMEGKSLVPAIDGVPFERGPVFSQATKPGPKVEPADRWGNLFKPRCVREGRFKYVFAPYLHNKEQLFDLEEDPYEQRDLLRLPERPPAVEDTRNRLRLAMKEWIREQPGHPSKYDDQFADDSAERLKSMGYGYGGEDEGEGSDEHAGGK